MICHIDCSNLSHAMELHMKLAELLDFPEWYGNNLDALYDCLTDLAAPVELHLTAWDHANSWSCGFETALADAQESNPLLKVIFE